VRLDKAGPEAQTRSVPLSQSTQTELHAVPKNVEPERAGPAADPVPAPASFHSGAPAPAHTDSPATPPVAAAPDNTPPPQKLAAPEPSPRAIRTELESPPEVVKPAAPAREIQLQVNRGEQRVDVLLTERRGEVLVAVRTPNAQLAGTLREDLPVLSARLEQAGYRAETWHPAALATETGLRTSQSHASHTSSQDQNPSRQGGQEQEQAPPRQPKSSAAKTAANSRQKEFAWLMSQLP
jgi:hypothetical protein